MAIVSFESQVKGNSNNVNINLVELETKVSSLNAPTKFNDSTNWKSVIITLQSTTAKEINNLVFKISEGSLSANFNPSLNSDDNWDFQSISILNHDDGSFNILKPELTELEFNQINIA